LCWKGQRQRKKKTKSRFVEKKDDEKNPFLYYVGALGRILNPPTLLSLVVSHAKSGEAADDVKEEKFDEKSDTVVLTYQIDRQQLFRNDSGNGRIRLFTPLIQI